MTMSSRVLLAAINAIGFSASTIMPLWIGGISAYLGAPAWFAGLAVALQIGAAAIFNLLTPIIFRSAQAPLARLALLVATASYMVSAVAPAPIFLLACAVSGAALGTLLNVTNRMMGSSEHVQSAYAIFVLIEVLVATGMFLGGAFAIARFGLWSIFVMVAATTSIGLLLLASVRIDGRTIAALKFAGPLSNPGRGLLCLVAFGLFMIGQASMNAFLPSIGQANGLAADRANQLIGFGMPAGLAGAIMAKILGERVRPIWPIAVAALLLSVTAFLMIGASSTTLFVIGVLILSMCTMLAVPYFFTILGALDGNGRYTALGPAMMLAGIAIGPSSAVLMTDRLGLVAVAYLSATALFLSLACLVLLAVSDRSEAMHPAQATSAISTNDRTSS